MSGGVDHVVMYSGGAGSYLAAKRVVEEYGPENVTLLFADTKIEDEDLYRFLHESAEKLGAHLEIIADGRTPWEAFEDEEFIGNSRVDICSRILKRDLIDDWIKEQYPDPDTVRIYIGIDGTEIHRYERLAPRKLPYVYEAPLKNEMVSPEDKLEELRADGIEPPRLYKMGFPHNNCGGFCVKAGIGQFKMLLEKMPERYAHHEQREKELRELIGKDVAILRDRRLAARREYVGIDPDDDSQDDEIPSAVPLPLFQLRARVEGRDITEEEACDFGGCGCALE